MKKRLILGFVAILFLCTALLIFSQQATAPTPSNTPQSTTSNVSDQQVFNKNLFSTTDPSSPWVIANKVTALPNGYLPADLDTPKIGGQLRAEATKALDSLVQAALKDGVNLKMISGYRSYNAQTSTYNNFVARDGQAAADTYSARPGHSEHQTGWAADLGSGICDLETCFGDTSAGIWLAANAHEYGFIIRYLLGKEAITGYQYEPWHIRYVGTELAAELHETSQTMEEFFGVVPAKQPY